MILDFNPANSLFILRVDRQPADRVQELMQDYGLELSIPASTASTAVLFTPQPYAAASFMDWATPAARPIQSKIHNLPIRHDMPKTPRFGIEQRHRRVDLDHRTGFPQRKIEIRQ